MIVTVKLRLKDKHSSELNRQARAVNFVWNYLNETQKKAFQDRRQFLSKYDLQKLTANSCGELNISGQTVKEICVRYEKSRRQHRKGYLRWRGRKSLGWVPYGSDSTVSFTGECFTFRKVKYFPMHMSPLLKPGSAKAGSFNQDARGRWYINVPVEVEEAIEAPASRVGIDLGLKSFATLSNGDKIDAPQLYRNSEIRIGAAQRTKKTKRARAIHAKVANRRKDFLHKASAKVAKEFGLIIVGDVSPSKLAKTSMAKSVNDAAWSVFRRMLLYKAIRHGGSAIVVCENFSSQVCSGCGSLPLSRPKGIADLSKRVWVCDDCGAEHDRDVNAAINIFRSGMATLLGGSPYAGSIHQPDPANYFGGTS